MTFHTLISEIFISVFFVAGYITLYELHVQWAFDEHQPATKWIHLKHFSVLLTTVLLCTILQYVISSGTAFDHLFATIQLLVVAYPLLNDHFSSLLFWTSGAIGGVFWFLNHPYDPSLFFIVATILIFLGLSLRAAISGFSLRFFRRFIRYGWWGHFGYGLVLSATYWFSYLGVSNQERLTYVALFVLMCTYSWGYSNFTLQRREDRDRLTHEVTFDSLTQIKSNTSYLNESGRLFRRAQTSLQPLTFVEFDLDNFKSINDEYSHLAGNGALTYAANIVRQTLQKSGEAFHFYRTGGEEFVILFSQLNTDQARPIITQCLEAVRNGCYHYDQESIKLTASFGVTSRHADDVVMNDLYSRADDSLYISKQHGRNCITIDGDTVNVTHLVTTIVTDTIFTQPILDLDTQQPICHEVMMRTFDHGRWSSPEAQSLNTTVQIAMVKRLMKELPISTFAINLTRAQFLDLTEATRLIAFVKQSHLKLLAVELLEMPTLEELISIGTQYRQAGILLLINSSQVVDDLDTFQTLLPYIDGLKLNLHQLPPEAYQTIIQRSQTLMAAHHQRFILEGINTQTDYRKIKSLTVQFGQGYYFSHPVLPRMI